MKNFTRDKGKIIAILQLMLFASLFIFIIDIEESANLPTDNINQNNEQTTKMQILASSDNRVIIDGNLSATKTNYDWCIRGPGTTLENAYFIENLTISESTGNLFTIANTSKYVIIKNCTFTGTGDLSYGILIKNANNVIIRNCTSTLNLEGILITNSSDIIMENNFCNNNDKFGIAIPDAENVIVNNNTIEKNGETGIYIHSAPNLHIENNTIDENTDYGIRYTYTRNTIINGNNISNSEIGICINGYANFGYNNTIIGNRIYDNTEAIYALNIRDSLNITDNSIYGNIKGIHIQNTPNSIIQNNWIYGHVNYGVNITDSNSFTIYNNDIGYAFYGIMLDNCNNSKIQNNSVYSNEQKIVSVENLDNLDISNNTLFSGGYTGVYMNYVNDCIFKNNILENKTDHSLILLEIYYSDNLVINDSIFRNSDDCIYSYNGLDNSIIGHNIFENISTTAITKSGPIDNLTVSDNEFSDMDYGLYASFGSDLSVKNNTFSLIRTAGVNTTIVNNAEYNYNRFIENDYGLRVSGTNTDIDSNNFTDCGVSGIYAVGDNYDILSNNLNGSIENGAYCLADDVVFADNKFNNTGKYGVYLEGNNLDIEKNEMSYSGNMYTLIYSKGNNIKVSWNSINSSGGNGIGGSGNNINITYNQITDCDNYGISLTGQQDKIAHNNCSNNYNTGIMVSTLVLSSIYNNTCNNMTIYSGIGVGGTSINLTITNNTCEYNYRGGIRLANGGIQNITISDNILRFNGYGGVYIYKGNNVTIYENIINSNENGINLEGSSFLAADNIIHDNVIADNSEAGILCYRSLREEIFDNEISNNPIGIHMKFVTDHYQSNRTVYSNTISDSSQYGIYSYLSDNNTLAENIIENCAKGIYLHSSNDNWIVYNEISACSEDIILIELSSGNILLHDYSNPDACFSYDPIIIYKNYVIDFFDETTSIDNIVEWQWNFNNGTGLNSTEQNPSFYWNTLGNYRVTLTVTDADGDVGVYSDTIQVYIDQNPFAYFTTNGTAIVEGQWISFSDESYQGNPPYTYEWDFDDGSANVTIQNPIHQYTSQGKYYPVLKVTDECGRSSYFSGYVNVIEDRMPSAMFYVVDGVILIDEETGFNWQGNNGNFPQTYEWNFGDGLVNSTMEDPSHIFDTIGDFTVTLTVTDTDGDVAVYSREITVETDISPSASFITNITENTIYSGEYIRFTDSSTPGNGYNNYQWNFNGGVGGNQSGSSAKTIQFSETGTYQVIYTITDSDGDVSVYKETINVIPDYLPTASFTANTTTIVQGEAIKYTNTSTGGNGALSLQWYVGFGSNLTTHIVEVTYNNPGTYEAVLTVTDEDGDISVYSKEVIVNPYPIPSVDISANATSIYENGEINFTSSVTGGTPGYTYDWNFGDETTHATEENPTHTFATTGTYTVILTITDINDQTCEDTITITVNEKTSPNPNDPEDPNDDPNDGLSGGAIAGIVIGICAVVGAGGFIVYQKVLLPNKKLERNPDNSTNSVDSEDSTDSWDIENSEDSVDSTDSSDIEDSKNTTD